jgi:hypothetical protein
VIVLPLFRFGSASLAVALATGRKKYFYVAFQVGWIIIRIVQTRDKVILQRRPFSLCIRSSRVCTQLNGPFLLVWAYRKGNIMQMAIGTKKMIEKLPERLRALAEIVVMMLGMNFNTAYVDGLRRVMIESFCDMLPDGGRVFSNDKLQAYWNEINSANEDDRQRDNAVRDDVTEVLMSLVRAALIID